MDKLFCKLMLLSSDQSSNIENLVYNNDFSDILRQVFYYIKNITYEFQFNGYIWTYTLWDFITLDIVVAIGCYIITKTFYWKV